MDSTITTAQLKEKPELAPLLAHWIYNEFWTDVEGVTEADLLERFKESLPSQGIPQALIAFYNNEPVGTVSLIESDDDDRPHFTPWLAALYVKPEARNLGIGKHLVQSLLQEAESLGVQKLYLGTSKPEFYVRLGASIIEEASAGFYILNFTIVR